VYVSCNSQLCLGNESKLMCKSIVSHYLLMKTWIWLLIKIFRSAVLGTKLILLPKVLEVDVCSLFPLREIFS